jgi:hypothetical protein
MLRPLFSASATPIDIWPAGEHAVDEALQQVLGDLLGFGAVQSPCSAVNSSITVVEHILSAAAGRRRRSSRQLAASRRFCLCLQIFGQVLGDHLAERQLIDEGARRRARQYTRRRYRWWQCPFRPPSSARFDRLVVTGQYRIRLDFADQILDVGYLLGRISVGYDDVGDFRMERGP